MKNSLAMMTSSAATLLLALTSVSLAQALDCGKAASAVEKAICADQKLKSVDDAMASAFSALRDAATAADRKALIASQRKWVKAREDNCGAEQGSGLTSCIQNETDERRRLLVAEPESGPGPSSRMMPVFIQQDGDPHHYDVDYTLIKFVKPQSKGEILFNAKIDKIGKEAPLKRQSEAARDEMTYSAYAAMAITYASPKLLAAKIDDYLFSGGAHGNGGTTTITIDLTRGVYVKASDLFDDKAVAALKTDCVKQIAEEKKDRNDGQEFKPADDPNYQEQTIVDYLKAMPRWTLWKDKAVLTFDAYAIGSYAEGAYECEFAMDNLKKLAKPGALLPE